MEVELEFSGENRVPGEADPDHGDQDQRYPGSESRRWFNGFSSMHKNRPKIEIISKYISFSLFLLFSIFFIHFYCVVSNS